MSATNMSAGSQVKFHLDDAEFLQSMPQEVLQNIIFSEFQGVLVDITGG